MTNTTYTITEPELNLLVASVIAAHERGDVVTISPAAAATEPAGKPFVGMTSGRRVEIPHGTELFKSYYDTSLDAVIDDGKVVWNGKAYDNLTAAALASGQSVNEHLCAPPSGYEWWQVKENDKWVRVVNSRFTEPKKK